MYKGPSLGFIAAALMAMENGSITRGDFITATRTQAVEPPPPEQLTAADIRALDAAEAKRARRAERNRRNWK